MAERKLIRSASPLLAILCILALSGCLSALTLNKAVISYDDAVSLSMEERAKLSQEAQDWHPNDLTFYIRPGHPGGEWPIKGDFSLRSFHAILTALG